MRAACSKGSGPYDAPVLCNYGVSAAACGIGASAAVAALHQAVTLSRSTPCISHTRLHQDICCCACVVVASVMKRESYVLIPALLNSTGRTLHSSVDWDASSSAASLMRMVAVQRQLVFGQRHTLS